MEEPNEIEIVTTHHKDEPDEEVIRLIIPDCCKYGYETCPHVAKKEKTKKRNVGL